MAKLVILAVAIVGVPYLIGTLWNLHRRVKYLRWYKENEKALNTREPVFSTRSSRSRKR